MERRRIITRAVIVALAVIAGAFVYSALKSGGAADECAKQLVDAATRHDSAYIDMAVRNPSVRAKLRGASEVGLTFVRPVSTEWTRVGLFVRTGTATEGLHLALSAQTKDCVFLRDYEQGAFGE